jgi:hypothetical protein
MEPIAAFQVTPADWCRAELAAASIGFDAEMPQGYSLKSKISRWDT